MKLCYIDLETTGLDCHKHGVVQIAGIIEIDGVEKDSFNIFCKPFPHDEINPEALEVQKIDQECFKDSKYILPQIAFDSLKDILSHYVDRYDKRDKFILVGYNAFFDSDFLRAFWMKNDNKYFGSWFWNPPIDVMVLAGWVFAPNRQVLENFKLETVAKAFGIQVDEKDYHDASVDIRVTKMILDKIRGLV